MSRVSASSLILAILAGSLSALLLLPGVDAFTFAPTLNAAKVGTATARRSDVQHLDLNQQVTASFSRQSALFMADDDTESSGSSGVVELADDDDEDKSAPATSTPAAPFLSQGEISEEALNPDLSDPKQTRVILYIIISLVPVLFLVPLMLGSRDLIPLDSLPPVEM